MKFKILLAIMVVTSIVSLSLAAFLFFVFSTMDVKPAYETAVETQPLQSADSVSETTADEEGAAGEPVKEGEEPAETDTSGTGTTESDTAEAGTSEAPFLEDPLKIVVVGDINLGRGVKIWVEKQEKRYIYPFEEIVGIFNQNDVVFGNLEEPITASTKGLAGIDEGGKYVLKNDPEAIEGIKYAGFNLLSLANNHILDYYEQGLFDTMKILDENGIAYAGAGRNLEEARKPAVLEKKGLKIGMLAYTDMAEVLYKGNPPLRFLAGEDSSGVAPTKKDYIMEDIAKYKDIFDILIVSLHWGVEYSYEPTENQIGLAHEIIDSGADMIIGHHTHRCQGVEIYKGKPIFYSLGNFLFDQNNPLNQESFIFEMEIKNRKLTALSGTPFKIINKSRIVPQKGEDALIMLERERSLSEKLNTPSRIENDKLVFDINW